MINKRKFHIIDLNMVYQFKTLLISGVFLLMNDFSYAQQFFFTKINHSESLPLSFQNLNGLSLDTTEFHQSLKDLVVNEQKRGFLLANLDAFYFENDTIYADVYIGEKYEGHILSFKGLSKDIVRKKDVKRYFLNSNASFEEIQDTFEKIITWHQNNGYPFATIKLDSIQNYKNQITASALLDKGALILFDSLRLNQDVQVKYGFLSEYLNIKYGSYYNQSKVDLIKDKINQLPFLKIIKRPGVYFQLGKGQVEIELETVKVNSIDGIAGFVPSLNGSNSRLTGELKLSIDNLFKSGKKINIEWQKLNVQSQFLDVEYNHLRFLHSPLNFSFRFNQLKEDTLFSNRSFSIGINYPFSPSLSMAVIYENKEGNNLKADNSEVGDFDINFYSLGITWDKLDDVNFPLNGFQLKSLITIGEKQSFFTSIKKHTSSNQYQATSELRYYKKFTRKNILYVDLKIGFINNNQLFLNDLFRFGGLNTIRGFNEKVFFASQYALFNLEWRWLISSNSYFLTFIDQAVLKHDINNSGYKDKPLGLGVGFKIKTKTGFFNLIYGLGKTDNQKFSFTNSKLHFGYSASL